MYIYLVYTNIYKKGGEIMKNTLETVMLIRISRDLKTELEKIAQQKERDLSKQVRMILRDYVERQRDL